MRYSGFSLSADVGECGREVSVGHFGSARRWFVCRGSDCALCDNGNSSSCTTPGKLQI